MNKLSHCGMKVNFAAVCTHDGAREFTALAAGLILVRNSCKFGDGSSNGSKFFKWFAIVVF